MPDTVPTFTDVTDVPPDVTVTVDSPSSFAGDTCLVCGIDLPYSGRGRHPRFCAEHRPTGSTRVRADTGDAPKGVPPVSPATQTALTRIKAGITVQVMGLGNMVRMVEAFDGSVLINQAEAVGETCETIARRDPKFRKACDEWLAKTGYIELAVMLLAIMTPIATHHGLMPPRLRPNPEWVIENEARQIEHASQVLSEYGMR